MNSYPCVICGETAKFFLHDGVHKDIAYLWPDERKAKTAVCTKKECSRKLRQQNKKAGKNN